MLPKRRRIPRELFPNILQSKSFRNSLHFTLRVGEFEGKFAKVAVSVSKKISKKAVTRNAVRRRAYSALRDALSTLKPSLYLIVAKNGADKLRGESLKKELRDLLNS